MTDPIIVSSNQKPILIQPFGNTTINNYGSSSNLSTVYVAGEAIAAYEVVALVDGSLVKASVDNLVHADLLVGITQSGGNLNSNLTVIQQGVITNSLWSFTPGQSLFLGLNGQIVTTPDFTKPFILPLGRAINATTILLDIGEAELI